jgi:hypothetical protein
MPKPKSICRNCKHKYHGGICTFAKLYYYGLDGDTEPEYCYCDDYIPSDNLEYLEMQYIKRGKKI